MKFTLVNLVGAMILANFVGCSPIVKRETNDLSPLNEVYVLQNDDDSSLIEEERHGEREKRKIGVIKLGVSNGIINFVFGKLDSFLDAKTKALGALDESNKAKNAIYGIDPKSSATTAFIGDIIGKKIQASTASIGPLINSAAAFVSTKGQGLVGALTSKLAPLSSLSSGVSGGSTSGSGSSPLTGILGLVTSLSSSSSSSSGGISAGNGGDDENDDHDKGSTENNAASGINLGAFANVGGGVSNDDIPKFDRNKVELDIPSEAFGTGFKVITAISKVISQFILNSAHRTESILEVFKPFFRGKFAITGLPSDNEQNKTQSKTYITI